MKLAEALLERKNLKTRAESLRVRAVQNALVQEGDQPGEDPNLLLVELDEVVAELGSLIAAINLTNNEAKLPDGTTVSEAIVQRDMLTLRRVALEQVANTAVVKQTRSTKSEVKFVAAVPVVEVRRNVDALSKACRELDAQIQAVNWTAELVS